MATYPIKMLQDENDTPFVPFTSIDGVQGSDGESLETKLNKKLELDGVYPVNSIYINTSDANPQTLFGGQWQKIQDSFSFGSTTAKVWKRIR